MVKGKSVKPFL